VNILCVHVASHVEQVRLVERRLVYTPYIHRGASQYLTRQLHVHKGWVKREASSLRPRSCLYGSVSRGSAGRGSERHTLKCSPFEKALWQYLHSIDAECAMIAHYIGS
jgi:hypothetical protein